jgi:hypothetical protein
MYVRIAALHDPAQSPAACLRSTATSPRPPVTARRQSASPISYWVAAATAMMKGGTIICAALGRGARAGAAHPLWCAGVQATVGPALPLLCQPISRTVPSTSLASCWLLCVARRGPRGCLAGPSRCGCTLLLLRSTAPRSAPLVTGTERRSPGSDQHVRATLTMRHMEVLYARAPPPLAAHAWVTKERKKERP